MQDCLTDIIIEIPYGSNIKYEFDDDVSKIRCDRILNTCIWYPGNWIYNTLMEMEILMLY